MAGHEEEASTVRDLQQTTELLMEARAGSQAAIDRLLTRHAGKLLSVIRLRMGRGLRSRMESQDILQATLLKAFDNIDQLASENSESLMGWLVRIAENEIRDQAEHHGRQRRDIAQERPLDGQVANVAARLRSQVSQVVLRESMERLEAALERLEPQHRDVIVLRKLEELSFAEIGRRFGKSPDACRMLLARAMTALTLAMEESR